MDNGELLKIFVSHCCCRKSGIADATLIPARLKSCIIKRFPSFSSWNKPPISSKLQQAIRQNAVYHVRILREIASDSTEAILGFALEHKCEKIITSILSEYIGGDLSLSEQELLAGFWLENESSVYKVRSRDTGIQLLFAQLLREYRDEADNNLLWYIYLYSDNGGRRRWRKIFEMLVEEYGLDPMHRNQYGFSATDLKQEIIVQRCEAKAIRVAAAKERYRNRYENISPKKFTRKIQTA